MNKIPDNELAFLQAIAGTPMSESQTPRTDAAAYDVLRVNGEELLGYTSDGEHVASAFARELEIELRDARESERRLISERYATRARLAELEVAVRNEISYALHEADYPCNRHSGEGYGMRKVAERIQKAIKAYKEGKK